MTCPKCKHGKTRTGTTTLVLERGKSTIIIKNVPAEVCDNCDESFISDSVSREVMELAERGVSRGIEIEIFNYAA